MSMGIFTLAPSPADASYTFNYARYLRTGDVDCDSNVTIGDAQKVARALQGLSYTQIEPCPAISVYGAINVAIARCFATTCIEPLNWDRFGNNDCDSDVDQADANRIAQWINGQNPAPCGFPGAYIRVGYLPNYFGTELQTAFNDTNAPQM